jgi:hypothetical protein
MSPAACFYLDHLPGSRLLLMLRRWEYILRLPDVFNGLSAAIKSWRITVSALIATCLVLMICVFWESAAIRLIASFHIFVIFITGGVLWETNYGRHR